MKLTMIKDFTQFFVINFLQRHCVLMSFGGKAILKMLRPPKRENFVVKYN